MTSYDHSDSKGFTDLVLAAGCLAALAGCSAATREPANDTTQVMQSLVSVLTADGASACIDSKTRGEPLAVFRTMMAAPEPSRRLLSWYAPQPLRPSGMPSDRNVLDDQIGSGRIVAMAPQQSSRPLSNLLQGQLDAAARHLSLYRDEDRVSIPGSRSTPRATVRWWVRNRFDRTCTPVYTASNPVVAGNLAFVSVTGGHRGTTYAFRKHLAAWSPVGQWTNWMY